jgi:formiminoglutamase
MTISPKRPNRPITRQAKIAARIERPDWLEVHRGNSPLLVAFPHTGTEIPRALRDRFSSTWAARRDADWWIDELYAFARVLGATTVRTRISRSVIDVNRDPSGSSLYPGQATTELCPTTNFDGEPLYTKESPDDAEIVRRRDKWFTPYHDTLEREVARLRKTHDRVVLYDAHSIRSIIPHLFDGELPVFNIGTNDGATCDPDLSARVAEICAASGQSHVLNGRFKGGWTTRRYGRPSEGLHAIQMELGIRSYLREPADPTPENWPPLFDPGFAAPVADVLREILKSCITFAQRGRS